ncbi:hypothetical protein EDD21DRAFT_374094 [Dissophora ornata]|nr:hypothetical protein EDD21DRAFT_374094 [Dissophora ornata]
MRHSRRSLWPLFGLALAALPAQWAAAKPTTFISPTVTPAASASPSPSSQAPAPTLLTPVSTSNMAYASDGSRLYIQGGIDTNKQISVQFFSLDLTSNWPAGSPAWTNLPSSQFSGGSGTVDFQGNFLATGQEDSATGVLCVYKNQSLTDVNLSKTLPSLGPIVTDPISGSVFFLGDGVVVDSQLALTSGQPPKITSGQAASWSLSEKAILSTYINSNTNTVELQKFTLGVNSWQAVNTTSIVTPRTSHCFVQNSSGSKFYLFGGANSNAVFNDLYIYDVATNGWTTGTASNSGRAKMACAVAGSTLIVWGGVSNDSVVVDAEPMLYDTLSNNWVLNFAASGLAPTTSTSISSTAPEPSVSKGTPGHSNVGATVGGVVGGFAIVALVAGIFVVSRRRNKRFAPKGNASRDMFSAQKGGGAANDGTRGPIEMGGYTTIPASPGSDATYPQTAVHAMHPPTVHPVGPSAPGHVAPYYQQPPPIPSRPSTLIVPRAQSQMSQASGMSQPHIIQSPFEAEPESGPQYPLIQPNNGFNVGPLPPQISGFAASPLPQPIAQPQTSGPYHDRRIGQENAQVAGLYPSLEPTTVDLIPISASEAGEGSQASRSNSMVSSRSVTRPMPSRQRSVARGAGEDNRRGLLEEPELEDSRRDSQESLEYLDI